MEDFVSNYVYKYNDAAKIMPLSIFYIPSSNLAYSSVDCTVFAASFSYRSNSCSRLIPRINDPSYASVRALASSKVPPFAQHTTASITVGL